MFTKLPANRLHVRIWYFPIFGWKGIGGQLPSNKYRNVALATSEYNFLGQYISVLVDHNACLL